MQSLLNYTVEVVRMYRYTGQINFEGSCSKA